VWVLTRRQFNCKRDGGRVTEAYSRVLGRIDLHITIALARRGFRSVKNVVRLHDLKAWAYLDT